MKVLAKVVAAGAIGCAGLFPTSASANPALPVLPDVGVLPLPDDLLSLPGLLSQPAAQQPAAAPQAGAGANQAYGAGAGAGYGAAGAGYGSGAGYGGASGGGYGGTGGVSGGVSGETRWTGRHGRERRSVGRGRRHRRFRRERRFWRERWRDHGRGPGRVADRCGHRDRNARCHRGTVGLPHRARCAAAPRGRVDPVRVASAAVAAEAVPAPRGPADPGAALRPLTTRRPRDQGRPRRGGAA